MNLRQKRTSFAPFSFENGAVSTVQTNTSVLLPHRKQRIDLWRNSIVAEVRLVLLNNDILPSLPIYNVQ